MNILTSAEFSLGPSNAVSTEDMPKSEIILKGRPTGKSLGGAVLEAAVKWDNNYLAFVTDDIPQEETLRIYLFDALLNLLDSATLGAMYSTGSFHDLTLVSDNIVRFRFIGGTSWTLELLHQKEFSIPFYSEPKGVHRPLGITRRFKISGAPLPHRDS